MIDHGLVKDLERDGEWEVTFLDTKVLYECRKCAEPVRAELEVFPAEAHKNYSEFHEKYLAQRKRFCADLAIGGKGRCLGTQERNRRGNRISGFRSSQIIGTELQMETVFISVSWDQELIVMKATVFTGLGSELASDFSGTLEWHMQRLTLFW